MLSHRRLGFSLGRRPGSRLRQQPAGRLAIFDLAIYRSTTGTRDWQGAAAESKYDALADMQAYALSTFNCPSRRGETVGPYNDGRGQAYGQVNTIFNVNVARLTKGCGLIMPGTEAAC